MNKKGIALLVEVVGITLLLFIGVYDIMIHIKTDKPDVMLHNELGNKEWQTNGAEKQDSSKDEHRSRIDK